MTLQALQQQILNTLDLTIRPLQSSAYSATCRLSILNVAIANAMRWLALNAPPELLDGSDSNQDTGLLVDGTTNMSPSYSPQGYVSLVMPADFVRLARVKLPSWHKAVREAIDDTSDKALLLKDLIAKATNDRPVAVISCKEEKVLSLYPATSSEVSNIDITTVRIPSTISGIENGTAANVPLPLKAIAPITYQAAGFALASMRDNDAKNFFDIAASFLK